MENPWEGGWPARSMMLEDLVMADASMVKGLIKRWRDGLL